MNNSIRVLALAICCGAAGGGFSGCASSSSTPEAKSARPTGSTATDKDGVPVLEIGMSTGKILEKLGQPTKIQPMDPAEKNTEIWVYQIPGPVRVTQVVTGMKSVPAMVPPGFAGEIRMVDEPQYSTAERRSLITLELLIFNGALAAQKAKIQVSGHYN